MRDTKDALRSFSEAKPMIRRMSEGMSKVVTDEMEKAEADGVEPRLAMLSLLTVASDNMVRTILAASNASGIPAGALVGQMMQTVTTGVAMLGARHGMSPDGKINMEIVVPDEGDTEGATEGETVH